MTAVHEPVSTPVPAGSGAGLTESGIRAGKVASAASAWSRELAGLNGRDPLLHYRDLKVGTLDLAAADPDNRKRLLDGDPVPISRLFPHEPLRSSALRTARAIRDGVRELAEERGVDACHLIVGVATWANPYAAHRPAAPVMMRRATITARDPAETDFIVEVAPRLEINPALLDAMDRQLGLRFSDEDLRDPDGELRYPSVVERLREFAPAHVVEGFSIAHRAVLGRFAREPLTLAADVEALAGELEHHEAIAALAGDADAARALRAASGPAHRVEHLVLPADSAQRDAVAAIAGGRNLYVHAPPGTGRTQTIANAVAELVALGQRVLVVGNKRVSLRDLAARLSGAGLGDVVVDTTSGEDPAEQVARVIATAKRLSDDEPPQPHAQAGSPIAATSPISGYLNALHQRREPWGISAYAVMAATSTATAEERVSTRFGERTLQRLGVGSFEAMRVKLREFTELGGLAARDPNAVWGNADVPDAKAAKAVRDALESLRTSTLPALRDAATRAAVEVGLAGPATPVQALETIDLLTAVDETLSVFGPQVWGASLDDLLAATADRRWRSAHGTRIGLVARRRFRLEVGDLLADRGVQPDRSELHARLLAAREQRETWQGRARDGRRPRTGEHLPIARTTAAAVREQLSALAEAEPSARAIADLPFGDAAKRLGEFASAEADLLALPRLNELHAELIEAGLGDVLDELRALGEATPARAEAGLTFAWHSSLLDLWRDEDPALRDLDVDELESRLFAAEPDTPQAADRVLAGRAARFAEVADEVEGQAAVVVESARGGRTSQTLRELVGAAPDVAVAAAPCWIASPLSVPTLLPARALFDVVIVEDAGLLPPAHIVSALARGNRTVIVGDREQVPLTSFVTTAEPTDSDDAGSRSNGEQASVLDLLGDVLPTLPLTTQYRARDDRLMRFAADSTYRGRMGLLPAAIAPPCLQHEIVGPDPTGLDSSEAEVQRVVDLILEHARNRRHESLGVVTLSRPHASRIDSALRVALVRNPDVAAFLDESRAEPFFVKDVARVAGDVRDAIIVSLGFGRSVDGRVLYRFGELDRPSGERQLAAAITGSRERTIVVSCFGADDLSPRRLTTSGGEALREFLAYSAEPTTPVRAAEHDPLVVAIAERLTRAGASVVLDHGDESGPIEIAVRHPKRSDRFVLAVETDSNRFPQNPGGISLAERTRHLVRLGWSVHRAWSVAWADDPDREAERVVRAYEKAVADADAYDWAVAAVEADVVAGMPNDESAADSQPDSGGKKSKRGKARSKHRDRGPRPPVAPRAPISTYTARELAAVARWVESDGRQRTEAQVVAEMARVLAQGSDDARTEDALCHAVRLARAGAPGL